MAIQRLPDLPSDEELRGLPVSESRVQRLLQKYLRERALTRTTEMLFDRVGALERLPMHRPLPEGAGEFGFKTLAYKRSFIDSINSLMVSEQAWAEGQEDFLLKYVGENLQVAVQDQLGNPFAGNGCELSLIHI